MEFWRTTGVDDFVDNQAGLGRSQTFGELSVSRFDASQDVKPAHRKLTVNPLYQPIDGKFLKRKEMKRQETLEEVRARFFLNIIIQRSRTWRMK
jgi:hypothetical protein